MRIKNVGTIIQPASPSETVERIHIHGPTPKSTNKFAGFSSGKVGEDILKRIAAQRAEGRGYMGERNGPLMAHAHNKPMAQEEPKPETPKAKPRDFGMER